MGWDIANYIAGAMCIIGPLFLVVWYFRAARKRIQKMKDK